jgi:hypothetical protein
MNNIQHGCDEDAASYLAFVQRLADEFRMSIEQVLPLYEQELRILRGSARVTLYLSVLTIKHVRDALQEEIRRREL